MRLFDKDKKKKKAEEKKAPAPEPQFEICLNNPSSEEYLEIYVTNWEGKEEGYILGPNQGMKSQVLASKEINIKARLYQGPLKVLKARDSEK